MERALHLAAIAASVLGVALFSGSETAFVSANAHELRSMAKAKVRGASLSAVLLARPATFLSMTLVGTGICIVLASSLATYFLYDLVGRYAVPVSTVVMASVILLSGEMMPKAVARANPVRFLLKTSPALIVAYYVLFPLAKATSSFASLLTAATRAEERTAAVTRDELRTLVREAAEAGFGLSPGKYAHRALDLSRAKVAGAMIPMTDVVKVDAESTVGEALKSVAGSTHSRYPVYGRPSEEPTAILHVKDLLGVSPASRVKVFARSAYFIPETTTIEKALLDMREEFKHMAIVTDEYGRAIGMVTFEDLIEEVVGEIADEYDRTRAREIGLDKVISGGTHIAVLNEELDTRIPEGDYSTVAGFILALTGSIPRAGEKFEHGDFTFEVIEVRGRRIRSVRITKRERPRGREGEM